MASGAGLVLTSIYTQHVPGYSLQEMEILLVLYGLFIVVKGLQCSGSIARLSQWVGNGRAIPLKLVMASFFLSMLVTNDVALIIIAPLTLTLAIERKDILVILEALAANAGSALTPIGNPQNLFIYWFYDLRPVEFIASIAPFSLLFLILLAAASLFIGRRTDSGGHDPGPAENDIRVDKKAWHYILLLVLIALTVLHILPVATGLVVILYALMFDRPALRVDYALLLSFFFFFGLAENIKILVAAELDHPSHIFLISAMASQVMSNVPASLLFAKFTPNWEALLWGANTGGFGSLFGSLANLIAYKIYVADEHTNDTAAFTLKFLILGYMAFFIAIGLYFLAVA